MKWKSKKGFWTLGYGFVAYFTFLELMVLLFTVLTILSIPSLYYYITFRGSSKGNKSMLDTFHMGNLGYAAPLCREVHLGVGKITMS